MVVLPEVTTKLRSLASSEQTKRRNIRYQQVLDAKQKEFNDLVFEVSKIITRALNKLKVHDGNSLEQRVASLNQELSETGLLIVLAKDLVLDVEKIGNNIVVSQPDDPCTVIVKPESNWHKLKIKLDAVNAF